MRSLSRILKQPFISPSAHVVTAATDGKACSSIEGAAIKKKVGNSEQHRAQIIQVMRSNLLATTKQKIAMLECESQKQAEKIINMALEEAKQLHEEAKSKGYEEGYQRGFEAGHKEAEVLITKAQTVLSEAKEEKNRLLAQVEPEALQLAFLLAEKILRHELTKGPETLAQLVEASARKFPKGEPVVLQIAPGELERWREAEDVLHAAMPQRQFEIVENDAVPPAEFMLSSAMGTVDARIQPQLEVLYAHLLGDDG
jgi:flagellar assembly protein FliH